MKIFITVGNGKFEELVKKVDELLEKGLLKASVTVQTGTGTYIPKNCKHFDFAPSLKKYESEADIVISHGGPGCIFEILDMHKKLIGVPNTDRTDPMHQVEYLRAIAESGSLILCEDVDKILDFINQAKEYKFKPYVRPLCNMDKVVIDFIEGNVKE